MQGRKVQELREKKNGKSFLFFLPTAKEIICQAEYAKKRKDRQRAAADAFFSAASFFIFV